MKFCQSMLLNGKFEAEKIFKALNYQIIKLPIPPGLAVILVGSNPASQTYVKIKEKRASEIGVYFEKHILASTVSEKKILSLINKLNKNKKITGILLQLPLPKKFNTEKIIAAVDAKKDVDGFKNMNYELRIMNYGRTAIIPPTIQAVLHLIKISKIKLAGKKAVILANSLEFAGPLKKELERYKIKVDILLKPNIKNHNSLFIIHYSIIIIALGKKYFLKPQMIKKNAIVIDVGITCENEKTFGDVHPKCFKKSKYISPVPGGVGPLTVAYLMKNLVILTKTTFTITD